MTEVEFLVLGIFAEGKQMTQDDVWKIVKNDLVIRSNSNEISEIIARFKKHEFLYRLPKPMLPPEIYEIKQKGIDAYNVERIKRIKEELEKDLQFKKLKYDVKISKFTFYTYWIMFALSVAAFILSVISLQSKG